MLIYNHMFSICLFFLYKYLFIMYNCMVSNVTDQVLFYFSKIFFLNTEMRYFFLLLLKNSTDRIKYCYISFYLFVCIFFLNNITLIFHLLNPNFKRTWNNGIKVSFGKNNRQFVFKFRLKHPVSIF